MHLLMVCEADCCGHLLIKCWLSDSSLLQSIRMAIGIISTTLNKKISIIIIKKKSKEKQQQKLCVQCDSDALLTFNIWLNQTISFINTMQLIYSIQSIRLTSHLFLDIFLVLILSAQQRWEWNGKRGPIILFVYTVFRSGAWIFATISHQHTHVCYIFEWNTKMCHTHETAISIE